MFYNVKCKGNRGIYIWGITQLNLTTEATYFTITGSDIALIVIILGNKIYLKINI